MQLSTFGTVRGDSIVKLAKMWGANYDSRKTGNLHLLPPVVAESRLFVIFAQLEEESCKTQKTKLVRKGSRINPEVESRRTAQYGERKLEEKARQF